MAVIAGAVFALAFVVLPLVGRPSVVRVAPFLLAFVLLLIASARPWRCSNEDWTAVESWQPSRRQLSMAALLAGVVVFWFVLTRFMSGEINGIDFTVYYDRPTFQTAIGNPQFVESADDGLRQWRSYFAIHAHWVMLPLAGLYLVWASPFWLLALSVVAVITGAVYTLRIVQHIGAGPLIACASGLAFILNDNTARTLNYGFHTEVLYAWFVPWMIYAGLQQRWRSFAGAALLCIAVKEDAFLLVGAASVAIVLNASTRYSRFEKVLLAAPVVVAGVNLLVFSRYLVPRFSATGAAFYANYWANFGPTPLLAVGEMLQHPVRVFRLTLTSSFWKTVLVPHLYLPFVGWRWLVGVLPIIVLYSVSANDQLRGFGIYYSIVLVPFLVMGAAAGAVTCARALGTNRAKSHAVAATAILCGSLVAGISNAGYSLRPWKSEIASVRDALDVLEAQQAVLVQSGLYPHAGYASGVQILTRETLNDQRFANAVLLLAPSVSGYPFSRGEIEELARLPAVVNAPSGMVLVRRPPR
jgi:uncharacterized membrane protein